MSSIEITVSDFKAQFPNDFNYLEIWLPTSYSIGDEVYFTTNQKFYTSLIDDNTELPTDEDSWELTEDSVKNYISDAQIENAMVEASTIYNESLFSTDATKKMGLLYLTAHFLVIDQRNMLSGGISSTPGFISSSRKAGELSETVAVPKIFMNNPVYGMFTQTGYGAKYLHMILPRLVGACMALPGITLP